ncbi:glycosyltransferase family 2 protein [Nocardioides sp. YIM 152315]|uniref:glycosyltransferase family 2 protein n=1 Tax=Nocardioides sp. YIM 152315 TaxID=3031760 RepID=UPI0023DCD541|nr:glycosyltransferase family 2 protein [Nocardioides sp. YIM 152315]MDF1603455.1 glycosyltransferase family 2 protein [Nocardioides sp. YIM 152315]
MTRVSVGLPVYNGERYLEQALDDLLAQTHADLEIVISDNGSTDRTQAICERYAALDSRIVYLRHEVNRGASWNHSEVVRRASGPYFRWYSYDDRLDPRCIEACAAVLDSDRSVVLAWPLTTVIDADGAVTSQYRADLPFRNGSPSARLRSLLGARTDETLLHMCYPVYGVIRHDVFLSTHLLGTMPGADTVLLCELALRGDWALVEQRLFYNRRHADSSAIDKTPEQISAWFDPDGGRAFPMPQHQLLVAYLRAVLTAPIGGVERARCLLVVARWLGANRQWRIILGEYRIRLRQLRARRPGRPATATRQAH